jgi:hypothetical protein
MGLYNIIAETSSILIAAFINVKGMRCFLSLVLEVNVNANIIRPGAAGKKRASSVIWLC